MRRTARHAHLQHLLGRRKVGDDTVFQRANDLDVRRGFTEHLLGCLPGGLHSNSGAVTIDASRHNRRLVENDTFVFHAYQRIRSA